MYTATALVNFAHIYLMPAETQKLNRRKQEDGEELKAGPGVEKLLR
jgi:hypothetical protein